MHDDEARDAPAGYVAILHGQIPAYRDQAMQRLEGLTLAKPPVGPDELTGRGKPRSTATYTGDAGEHRPSLA